MNTTHFKKLERMYLQANVNTMVFNSTSCNIKEGEAEIGLTISESISMPWVLHTDQYILNY